MKAKKFLFFQRAVAAWMVAWCAVTPAKAGFEGSWITTQGAGQASCNIKKSGTIVASSTGAYSSSRPSGSVSSSGNYASATGYLPGVWSTSTSVASGYSADSENLDWYPLNPVGCATFNITAALEKFDATHGDVSLLIYATDGTVYVFHVLRYKGNLKPGDDGFGDSLTAVEKDANGNPVIDPITKEVHYLNSDVVWTSGVAAGPEQSCGKQPFPATTIDDLFLVFDGKAASVDNLALTCPTTTVVVGCSDTSYPVGTVTATGGCGTPDVSYSVLPGDLTPDVPTQVTVTAVDGAGSAKACTFTAVKRDAHGAARTVAVDPNSTLTFPCSATVTAPNFVFTGCWDVASRQITLSPALNKLPAGTTLVTATATDKWGSKTCTFGVTRTVEFGGYQPPLDGPTGSCASSGRLVSNSRNFPVKFTETCNGQAVTSGTPTLLLFGCPGPLYPDPAAVPLVNTTYSFVAQSWHANFNGTAVLSSGKTYQLVTILQDGTWRAVFFTVK